MVLQRSDTGNAMVALVVGSHDHIDSFLDGHKGYVFDTTTGKLKELRLATASETQVEMVSSAELNEEQAEQPLSSQPLFVDFTDAMLERIGVPEESAPTIRAITDPNSVDCMIALQCLGESKPAAADILLSYATGNRETRQTVIDLASGSAVLTPDFPDAALSQMPASTEEFVSFDDPADLEEVLERSTFEQWQLFLHPDQRSLVQRKFTGPARLRGISGSGKTVVALHRARSLAKVAFPKGQKVLFTTFDKGLAAEAGRLLDSLCGAEREAIEVTHLHRWCLDYLSFRSLTPHYAPQVSKEAQQQAIKMLEPEHQKSLRSIPISYIWDEIAFLMGRFLHEETRDYLTTDRGGRGRPLTNEQRRAILRVYGLYHKTLLSRGYVEPSEFVRMAYRKLREGELPEANYAAVIVDEVQDISEIGLRMLHSIVGDRPDGLLLVGDATQRIFTRGFTLRGLGIDISGRGIILRKNYRNTRQILEASFPLVEREWTEDVAESGLAMIDTRPEFSVREGCRPIIVHCPDEVAEQRFLASEIAALLKYKHYNPHDICVLARNRYYRDLAHASLKGANIPVFLARDPVAGEVPPDKNAVKVSSLHGAKGHEYGTVFVIGFVNGVIPLKDTQDPQGEAEEAAVLYVGMTRARDLLYLSYSSKGRNQQLLSRSPFYNLISGYCDFARFKR